jgi:DNA-binding MarR family transcriptional regulator
MEQREWEHLHVDNMHGAYQPSSAGGTLDLVGAAALAISEAVWTAVGLERSEAAALNLVLAENGVSIGALARGLGLSHSAAVRVVDRLERRRLLRRTTPGPGRTVALEVTARGRRRAEQSIGARARILERATAGLSPDERETLLGLLARAVSSLAHDQDEIDRACRLCDQRDCIRSGCPLPVRR